VKLLFDENLSRHLITRLAAVFPDSAHVAGVGLEHTTDREVWQYARDHDFVLVSKDSDFNDPRLRQRAAAEGHLATCRQRLHRTNRGAARRSQ
jgi:predicted nuclease of predicted toxin-antitoxin system